MNHQKKNVNILIFRFSEFVDLQRDESRWVDDKDENNIMSSVRILIYSLY